MIHDSVVERMGARGQMVGLILDCGFLSKPTPAVGAMRLREKTRS